MDGMSTIICIAIGTGLAWLIGVNTWNIPLSEITGGMVFRNLAAFAVFWIFFCAGLEQSD